MTLIEGRAWTLRKDDDGLWLIITFDGGEVRVSVGDGRYLAQRVHELVVGPAIALRDGGGEASSG